MKFDNNFWINAYHRNIKKLIGICYRYIPDRQVAEDLAHDSFMKAMNKSKTFRGEGHFDAWLRKITVNTALQHYNQVKSIQKNQQELIIQEITSNDEDMQIGYNFSIQELLEAVEILPEHHKIVFNLYVIDEYSHKQIAEMLKISEGTSKSHLARAKKKLQNILKQKHEEKQKEKAYVFLLFPMGTGKVCRIFKSKFSNFKISPQNTSFLEHLELNRTNIPRHTPFFITLNLSIAIGAIVIISAIAVLINLKRETNESETSNAPRASDTIVVKKDTIRRPTAPGVTKNNIDTTKPVVIKKKRIIRKTVIIKDSLFIIDSSNVH